MTDSLGKENTNISENFNGVEFSDDTLSFHYHNNLIVQSLSPIRGHICGGTGFKLYQEVSCRLGSNFNCVGSIITESIVLCTLPDEFNVGYGMNDALLPLTVSLNGQDYTSNVIPVPIQATILLRDVFPNILSVDGGTIVTVSGTNFFSIFDSGAAFCLRRQENQRQVTCITPTVIDDSILSFVAPSGDCIDSFS